MLHLVRQNSPTTCGQACVATLLGITLEQAISRFGHDGTTEETEVAFAAGTEGPFLDGAPSSDIVAIQKHEEPNGDRAHWTISCFGKTMDPACIRGKLWPVTRHVRIDWIKTPDQIL